MPPQRSSCCRYNQSYPTPSSAWNFWRLGDHELTPSTHRLSHAMFESKMPLPTGVITTPQTASGENATMPPQRLDAARERINTVCAEHNNFNPNSYLTHQLMRFSSRIGQASHLYPLPPHPAQLRADLQQLFERVRTLESVAADQVYEDMSMRIWEMANDEYSEFDWKIFKDVINRGVYELNEQGHWVAIYDLVTLRSAAPLW
jgi:hypothetical protein